MPPAGLAVVPAQVLATPDAVVPMAGTWSADGDALRFTARFGFASGTSYALVRRGREAGRWRELGRLERPTRAQAPTTTVVAIHPSAEEVPVNLLRLSVTFSAPMAQGSAAGHVHLQGPSGADLAHALLAMPPELWDSAGRRLTLLLDPGRIKRGLVPNTVLGAPLAHVGEVSLVVDAGLRDASGAPLTAGARRTYRVGPEVRSRVEPGAWQLAWPPAGSRQPLVVGFDRPLDHALLLRCLRIAGPGGGPLPGRPTVGEGDVEWSFVPARAWPDDCELHVDADLEDLAGNSARRVFDRDLHRAQDDPLDVDEVVLTPDGRIRTRP